jgi:hypothetical protein
VRDVIFVFLSIGEKPFRCLQQSCLKRFRYKGDLSKHIRKYHPTHKQELVPIPLQEDELLTLQKSGLVKKTLHSTVVAATAAAAAAAAAKAAQQQRELSETAIAAEPALAAATGGTVTVTAPAPQNKFFFPLLPQHPVKQSELGIQIGSEPSSPVELTAGTSSAGLSSAGLSSAGLSSAGLSSAGLSSAGLSSAGLSSAGLSSAGLMTVSLPRPAAVRHSESQNSGGGGVSDDNQDPSLDDNIINMLTEEHSPPPSLPPPPQQLRLSSSIVRPHQTPPLTVRSPFKTSILHDALTRSSPTKKSSSLASPPSSAASSFLIPSATIVKTNGGGGGRQLPQQPVSVQSLSQHTSSTGAVRFSLPPVKTNPPPPHVQVSEPGPAVVSVSVPAERQYTSSTAFATTKSLAPSVAMPSTITMTIDEVLACVQPVPPPMSENYTVKSSKQQQQQQQQQQQPQQVFRLTLPPSAAASASSAGMAATALLPNKPNKPFPCDYPGCNRSFEKANLLRRHSKLHSGDCKSVCSVCQKCFESQSKLDDHYRKHTGEKPFVCTVCGNSFRYKGEKNERL